MKNSVNYHIRPGRRDDIPQILDLVKALAEYERLADQVSASENLYEKHGFGAEPRFQTLVVESGTGEGPFLGFALYFFTFSTFLGRPSLYLEDLFVRPEFRGMGIGKVLLSELAKIAQRNDCGRMEWAVSCLSSHSADA